MEEALISDHKALENLLTSKTLSKRLFRIAFKLQEKNLKIIYSPGKECGNADALSKQEWQNDGAVDQPQEDGISS